MPAERPPAPPFRIGRRVLAPLVPCFSLLLVPIGCLAEPGSACRRFAAIPAQLEIGSRYVEGRQIQTTRTLTQIDGLPSDPLASASSFHCHTY